EGSGPQRLARPPGFQAVVDRTGAETAAMTDTPRGIAMTPKTRPTRFAAATLLLALLTAPATADPPLALHPRNPHYFLFRGKPTVLITSTEHYGAVLNRDFDYVPYLDELAARGLNLTRTFSGVYREVPDSFGIVENTLAPKPDRFVCPWARGADG